MAFGDLEKLKKASRPRKPQISPTKIRTFLDCPLMYKYVYIDKIGRFHYTPNIGDSFGSSLHRALQDFHASGGHDTQTSEQLVERLRSTWVGVGYGSSQEETEHLNDGMRMLDEYYINSKLEAVTIFTERQLKMDMGNFFLIGRIDRLDERSDGVLEIIDYKTGRSSVTEDEVANDLAMSIYQLLVKKNYPGKRAVATIHCLRTGRMASAELSDNELVELEEMVLGVAADMLGISNDTEILPERKIVCDRCDFIKMCQRKARIAEIVWSS
jgi:RecB family exonuclease